MVKINRHEIFFLLALVLLVLSACAKKEVECATSADCLQKACHISRCAEDKCSYNMQTNCCGNGLQEGTENGKPGNKCSCPKDYGACEGRGRVGIGGRTQNTTYIYYHCNEKEECVFGINEKDIEIQNFYDTISIGFFKASVLVTYNKPINVNRGTFKFRISLDDAGKDIVLPVTLTKLKLFYSPDLSRAEQIISEKELDSNVANIGDEILIEAPLGLGYKPKEVEETGSFRYVIDYKYEKSIATGKAPNGSFIYSNELVRSSFNSLAKPVFFVKSE